MAVTVLLEVTTQPDKSAGLLQLLKDNLGDTRAYDGCIGLEVVTNQDDNANILLIERWQSRAQYEKYLAWRAESGFVDKLGEFLAAPPSIRFFNLLDA